MKRIFGVLKKTIRSIGVNVFSAWYNRYLVTEHEKIMSNVGSQGNNVMLSLPLRLSGARYMKIGNGVVAGPGLWMECIDKFNNQIYNPELIIGDDVRFSLYCHIGVINSVTIGNNVLIGSKVLITDHSHGELNEQKQPYYNRDLISKGPVVIEDNVWIGDNACILSGVTIGMGSIVAANAVVVHDVPPFSLVAGVPAKVVKQI